MTILEIRISGDNQHFLVGGNMDQLAEAITKLALHNEPFLYALNKATELINEDIEAVRLRDEMIGFILNTEQK